MMVSEQELARWEAHLVQSESHVLNNEIVLRLIAEVRRLQKRSKLLQDVADAADEVEDSEADHPLPPDPGDLSKILNEPLTEWERLTLALYWLRQSEE